MRKFYLAFPILDAVRQELSWTHYRLLSRLETEEKRLFYIEQSADNGWNSRELERNIHTLYFERSLAERTAHEEVGPTEKSLLKDPYIFEFLGVNPGDSLTEKDIET